LRNASAHTVTVLLVNLRAIVAERYQLPRERAHR
jgi:hypothetical protein